MVRKNAWGRKVPCPLSGTLHMPPSERKEPAAKRQKAAGGRPVGVPSYNRVEHVAIAAASLEANEMKQTNSAIDLAAIAASKYAGHLDLMVQEYGWPVVSTRAGGTFTVQRSKEVRGQPQIVWKRWNEEIKPHCLNHIQGVYSEFLVSVNSANGKDLPSGTTKEDADRYVRGRLWRAEKLAEKKKERSRSAAIDVEANSQGGAGGAAKPHVHIF